MAKHHHLTSYTGNNIGGRNSSCHFGPCTIAEIYSSSLMAFVEGEVTEVLGSDTVVVEFQCGPHRLRKSAKLGSANLIIASELGEVDPDGIYPMKRPGGCSVSQTPYETPKFVQYSFSSAKFDLMVQIQTALRNRFDQGQCSWLSCDPLQYGTNDAAWKTEYQHNLDKSNAAYIVICNSYVEKINNPKDKGALMFEAEMIQARIDKDPTFKVYVFCHQEGQSCNRTSPEDLVSFLNGSKTNMNLQYWQNHVQHAKIKKLQTDQRLQMENLGRLMEQPGCVAYMILGNPGAGKSTLANCLAGYKLFTARSSSAGVTKTLQYEQIAGGRVFIDTPGLADLTQRNQAASAITEALHLGGEYCICFLLCARGSRLPEEEITTMREVLAKCWGEIKDNQFGVIVNQCEKKVMTQSWKDETKKLLFDCSPRKTKHVYFAPRLECLVGEDDAIAPMDPELQSFMFKLPVIWLHKRSFIQCIYKGKAVIGQTFGQCGTVYATFDFKEDGTLEYQHTMAVHGFFSNFDIQKPCDPMKGQYAVSEANDGSKQVEWKGSFIEELKQWKEWGPPPADYKCHILLPEKAALSDQGDVLTIDFKVKYWSGETTIVKMTAQKSPRS